MDKNLYNQNIRIFIFNKNFIKLLELVDNYINSEGKYSFKNLIEFLHTNKELINALNYIFLYDNKKSSDFCKKLIWVTCILHKKQTNFTFKIDNSYRFIYDEEQKDELNPTMVIKDDFYFWYDTKIKCKKANHEIKLDTNKNRFKPGLEISKVFLQIIEYFAGVNSITKNEINKMFDKFLKNEKSIIIPKNRFI